MMTSSLILILFWKFPPKCKSVWYEVSIFIHASLVGCYVDNKVQLLTPKGFPAGAEESFLRMSVILRPVRGDACRMYREK